MTAQKVLEILNNILTDTIGFNLHEENVESLLEEPLYQAFKDNKIPAFGIDSGATKVVIIFKGLPFVVKIPFCCSYSENAFMDKVQDCEKEHPDWDWGQCCDYITETVLEDEFLFPFENATNNNFDLSFLAEHEELLTGSDYCALETCYYKKATEYGVSKYFAEEEFIGYIAGVPIYIQQRAVPFYEHYESENSDERNSDRNTATRIRCKEMECYCFDETWIADFFDAYGEEEFKKLSRFLSDFEIGDLRRANIGYVDGRPILFDYAGYNEW